MTVRHLITTRGGARLCVRPAPGGDVLLDVSLLPPGAARLDAVAVDTLIAALRALTPGATSKDRDRAARGPSPTAPPPEPGQRCPRCHRRYHTPGCALAPAARRPKGR
jgi:hypothetical protein